MIEFESQIVRMRVMINSNVIENFINQLKIKKLDFQNEISIKSNLKILNDIFLKTYHAHNMRLIVTNNKNFVHQKKHITIEINMNEIDMILKLS